ncbi:MAG: hypothetical protein NT076_04720, partial [Candidatus Pacearchaeota archaeon]|nr:hypothetical protein [Candidatus Pacearchaeota archaeon]
MSYKKFINRNGKAYGPYIYESKREGNKVVSEYQGKAKNHFLLPIAIIFIILAGFLFIRFFQPTGRVVLQVSPVYNANETIFGDLKIKLKPGELLPADSKVSFKLNNQQIELPISQILSINSSEGKYYAENVNLEGEGQGYGFIGEKVSYPKVSFKLLVYQAGIAEQPSTPVEGTPETQETPAQSNETTSQEKTETTPSETSSTTETATTTETESTTPTTEIPQAEPAASETATQAAETSAPTAESIPAPVEAGITGGIIAESKIINGVVSKNQDYVYDLSQGESGTIVQGSIKTVDKNLSLDSLNLVVENDKAIVTTSYYESELGFGKDFLGENAETIMLSLKEIGFKAEVGILEVSIVYNDVKIAEAASKIMISEISENKFQEKSSGLELNETINETKIITEETNNITLKTIQYRPILGKPVRWQKNVKLETAGKVALEIPAESENISASKIIGGEEIQIKKDDIGTVGITGQVSLELELVRENALVRFLKKVWGSITGKAIEEVIGEENASVIIAEMGVNMDLFPT